MSHDRASAAMLACLTEAKQFLSMIDRTSGIDGGADMLRSETPMAEKHKSFAAYTAGEARKAASAWLRNFKDHGPLEIRSIQVTEERDLFVATVDYAEMAVEESPQYFPNYQPVRKSA